MCIDIGRLGLGGAGAGRLGDGAGAGRLARQLGFALEADKMKRVYRQTPILDLSRPENDAEHSWHLGLTAMLLHEYAAPGEGGEPPDIGRVLQMAAVHDLVEIYAGDTFAYDDAGNATKAAREREAADRLFGMLPEDQGAALRALWEEFDEARTPEARYAASIDRLQPFLVNVVTDGYTWRRHGTDSAQVRERMGLVKEGAPALWPAVEGMIEGAVARGVLKEAGSGAEAAAGGAAREAGNGAGAGRKAGDGNGAGQGA